MSVNLAESPEASVPGKTAVTIWPAAVIAFQVPRTAAPEAKVRPAGSESRTVIPALLVLTPMLRTVTVYVPSVPCVKPAAVVLVIVRSTG